MLTLELSIEYSDGKTAEAVMKALGPDNEGYVASELEGNILRFRAEASNAGTMRNTADDLMACIKTAEETLGVAPAHQL